MFTLSIVGLMLALILLRVPVAFAIAFSGIVGIYLLNDFNVLISLLGTTLGSSANSYSLSAIPLFILMAQLVLLSGVLGDIFDAAKIILGRIRGGTGIAAIGAGSMFAAVSGSSTAAAAALSHTSSRQMIAQGYSPRIAAGLVAVAGTLAAMVPPSILLVFYAITAELSVGKVLVAGFVPGTLVALSLVVTLLILMRLNPNIAPDGQRYQWAEKIRALNVMIPVILLFAMVVGTIYFGVATPTESAALGCLGALLLMISRRQLRLRALADALVHTISSSVMILFIIVGAHIFGHLLVETQVTPRLIDAIGSLTVPPIVIMLLIVLLYVVLGFFMDQIAIIALTVPVVVPMVVSLGYDPVWFGVLIILLAEIGLVTPPLGLNVFVVARAANLSVEDVFKGVVPFVLAVFVIALLILAWPDLVLFVPNSMTI